MSAPANLPLRRVEQHLGTVVTLAFDPVRLAPAGAEAADAFFDRIRRLEALLSRFRPDSQVSRLAAGTLCADDADPAVREVLQRCEALRRQTNGDFEHEPRRRSGNPADPVLDVNALAKGWIVQDASVGLQLDGGEFFVNAGGDVLVSRRRCGSPWRVGIQHPTVRDAVLGVVELEVGAVATSGRYERGDHVRSTAAGSLVSVTVVGPDLAEADALSTAVFASGEPEPTWWGDVDDRYGLLTVNDAGRLRWTAPTAGFVADWCVPGGVGPCAAR